jgi:uncharacterized membrane protein YjjP (DUF1212 family)
MNDGHRFDFDDLTEAFMQWFEDLPRWGRWLFVIVIALTVGHFCTLQEDADFKACVKKSGFEYCDMRRTFDDN